ncbi:MAG: alkaline phosphatase [Bacteroidetes bacterium]|nr:alkaline phosphatase [Bacteroidota bacterium]
MNRLATGSLVLSALLACWTGIRAQGPGEGTGGERPRNVILLIGDGMGLSQVSSPYYFSQEPPAFSRFKHIGLARTSSADAPVTQSPAAATALATGHKTYNLAVGVDADKVPRENIVELLSKQGFMTGVIATSSITDATPAGFYAHQPDRYMQHEIAHDLVQSEIDFFAGGGIKHFLDSTGADHFEPNGIEINFTRLKKIKNPVPGSRYGFLLGADRMPTMLEGRKTFLRDAATNAIEFLSTGEDGYFLMVEGSQIDWAGHGNQVNYMISEMNDFNQVVNRVLDMAMKDGETLVIVTADHETGGFTLGASGTNGYDADYSEITPTFASTNHSAALVPVFSFGPGAENFTGVYENTEIFHKLVLLLDTK